MTTFQEALSFIEENIHRLHVKPQCGACLGHCYVPVFRQDNGEQMGVVPCTVCQGCGEPPSGDDHA